MKSGPQQNLIRSIIVMIRSAVLYDQHLWLLATAQFLFLKSDKSVFGLHWREKTKDQQSIRGLIFSKEKEKDLMVNIWLNAETETKTIESCYIWPKKRNAFSLILLQVSPQKRPLFTSDESGQVLNYLPLSSFLGTFINVSHFLPNLFIKLSENWFRSFKIE